MRPTHSLEDPKKLQKLQEEPKTICFIQVFIGFVHF